MTAGKSKPMVMPLRVFVGPGTEAEKAFHGRKSMPRPEAIAPGIPPSPAHDLIFHGGHTIADLVFTNFYIGGTAAWKASDIENIDKELAAAMSDVDLNNVMAQYYPSGKITSTFQPSQTLAGAPPKVFSQGDVENLVQQLFAAGTLQDFDFVSTVFNFMLPSGTILNTDEAPTGGAAVADAEKARAVRSRVPVEEEEDSTQGLGGYHGSVHVEGGASSAKVLYYAVGVYSENLPDGTVNGIPVFDQSWKNVVATFYHELDEARTDPDVEDAIRAGNDPKAVNLLGWTSKQGEECGDFPVFEANPLTKVFQEVKLTNGDGTVPVQFQYSNHAHGPEGPQKTPAPFAGQLQAKGAGQSHGGGHSHGGGKKKKA
jgi:hypothetical protein